MSKLRVILADDHALVRAGLRLLIDGFDRYTVVGEAGDGSQAAALAGTLRPDLMVLDLSMPGLGGIDALPAVKQASPGTRVLVLSMCDTRDTVLQALRRGADGYLLKGSGATELRLALDAVTDGHRFLSPEVSTLVVQQALVDAPPAPVPAHELALTPRQLEVLKLFVAGRATKEIAFDLGLSVKTVETHRAQVMERLGIRDVPRLVLYAVRHGLVSADAAAAR